MKRKPFNHKLNAEDDSAIIEMLAEQTPIYIMAKKLKVDRHALSDYIKSNDAVLSAYKDREEAFKDTVEYEIQRKIVEERNLNAMIYYANCKMRDRGYGEHIETENTDRMDGMVVFGEIPDSELPPEGN